MVTDHAAEVTAGLADGSIAASAGTERKFFQEQKSKDRKTQEADKFPMPLPRWPLVLAGLVVVIFAAVVLYTTSSATFSAMRVPYCFAKWMRGGTARTGNVITTTIKHTVRAPRIRKVSLADKINTCCSTARLKAPRLPGARG